MRDYSFLAGIADKEQLRIAMRELVKEDLYFLCRHVLNYTLMETKTDIHYRTCADLDADPYRLLVLIFRGAFKTSIGCGKVIQWLCRDPGAQIGIGSDIKERAEERVKMVKYILETNKTLPWLFPEIFYDNPLVEAATWRNDGFDVKLPEGKNLMGGFRVRSVNAFGLDPLPTGAHYSHVLLDDVENDSNQRNDAAIDKLNTNLAMFTPIPHPSAPIIMLGTIYSKHGPNTVFQRKWRTLRIPIMDAYGKPTFPSRFPTEVIIQKREEAENEWMWAGQFMLKAVDRTDQFLYPFRDVKLSYVPVINRHIMRNGRSIPLDECRIYIVMDPSGGADVRAGAQNSKLDKVGWCVAAVDLTGRWTILDLQKQYLSTDQFLDKMFDLDKEWHPYVIGVEKMPHLQRIISEEIRKRKHSLKLAELKPARRKKSDRIRSLLPIMGGIDFSDELLGVENTMRAYHTSMEHGDDDLDALAYLIDIVTKPSTTDVKIQRFEHTQREDAERLEQMDPFERAEWERFIEMEKRAASPSYAKSKEFNDDLEEFYGNGFDGVGGEGVYY